MALKPIFIILAVSLFIISIAYADTVKPQDNEIKALIAKIPTIAMDEGVGGQGSRNIVEELNAFHGLAIPYLLPLLKSKDLRVRDFVGYVLRDQVGLTEKHLDVLMDACHRGNGWLPLAIERIGTPRAIKFLVEELKYNSFSGEGLIDALVNVGSKVMPEIVVLFKNPKPLSDQRSREICYY